MRCILRLYAPLTIWSVRTSRLPTAKIGFLEVHSLTGANLAQPIRSPCLTVPASSRTPGLPRASFPFCQSGNPLAYLVCKLPLTLTLVSAPFLTLSGALAASLLASRSAMYTGQTNLSTPRTSFFLEAPSGIAHPQQPPAPAPCRASRQAVIFTVGRQFLPQTGNGRAAARASRMLVILTVSRQLLPQTVTGRAG